MKIEKFEDVRIWQESRELVKSIYSKCTINSFKKDYSLLDQVKRASVSIMANIFVSRTL